MNISDWLDKILSDPVAIATLVLALVTAILAFAAFRSINEQRKDRIEDRKERLLNEIIEWAEDVLECIVEDNSEYVRDYVAKHDDKYSRLANKGNIDPLIAGYRMSINKLNEFIFKLSLIGVKSHYIKDIASIPLIGQDLKCAVANLINELELHIELQRTNLENKIPESVKEGEEPDIYLVSITYVENIANHLPKLKLSAKKVIEEATKLRTKDIG